MKLRYVTIFTLTSMLLFTGCSIIEDVSKKVGYTPKKKVTAVATPTADESPVKPENKEVSNPVKTTLKQTEETSVKKQNEYRPDNKPRVVKDEKKHNKAVKVSQKDYDKLNGEWSIMSVFGEKIIADEHPALYFESSKHRFYGNNGCNTINGTFDITSENHLKLTDIATTMMLCPDAQFEYKINQALNQIYEYELVVKGQDSFLNFKSYKGGVVMTLHRSDNTFIDGAWQVMAVNGDRMAVNDDMRLILDVTEGKVHGNVGCNIVNGNVLVDSEQTSSIQFTSLMTSRMTCPDQALETALLLALENVTSWRKDGNTHVILTDASGKELVKLRKISRSELGL